MSDDGDKTEDPSPKRLADARRKGQVPLSKDLSGGVVFTAVMASLVMGGGGVVAGLLAYLTVSLRDIAKPGSIGAAGPRALLAFSGALSLPLGVAFGATLVAGLMQTRGLFAVEALKFDPDKLKPSFKRILGKDSLIDLCKGMVKVSVAGAIAWAAVRPVLGSLASLTGASPVGILGALGGLWKTVGLRLGVAAVAIGGADFLWQRHKHLKSLRMSHEDLKREYKDAEGDPHHKAERQRLHHELMEERMVNDVRKADFVVVNPDHIAIAIRYDRDQDEAPVVLAKGERLLAEKIKQVAREAGVPIFRDVSLARSLRDVVEGDEIPEALYEAVAEILRVVQMPEPARTPGNTSDENEGQPATPPSHWTRV